MTILSLAVNELKLVLSVAAKTFPTTYCSKFAIKRHVNCDLISPLDDYLLQANAMSGFKNELYE